MKLRESLIDLGVVLCSTWSFVSFLWILPLDGSKFNGLHFAGPYLQWMSSYTTHGLVSGYYNIADQYPPGVYSILIIAAKLGGFLALDQYSSFKLMQTFFFSIASLLAYVICRDIILTIMFQLFTFVGSVIFAGTDIFFIPFIVVALIALKNDRYIISSVSLSFAILIKWQPIWLLPFFAVYLINRIRQRSMLRSEILYAFLPPLLITSLVALVFGIDFFHKLFEAVSLDRVAYSANTLNLGWVVSFWLGQASDKIEYTAVQSTSFGISAMKLSFTFLYLFTLYQQIKTKQAGITEAIIAMAVGYSAFLLLFPGIHVNYWIILSVLLFVLTIHFKKALRLFLYVGLMANINLLFFYSWKPGRAVFGIDSTLFLAIANCCVFGWCVYAYFKNGFQVDFPKTA